MACLLWGMPWDLAPINHNPYEPLNHTWPIDKVHGTTRQQTQQGTPMPSFRSTASAALSLTTLLLYTGCQAQQGKTISAPTETHIDVQTEQPKTLQVVKHECAQEQATLALLDKRVSLQNENLPLRSVIQFIREATGANVVVNWPALQLVDIDRDVLVAINLKNVTTTQLLELTLDQVSADAFDDDKAGFAVRGSIIEISTLRALKSATVLRQYSLDEFANVRPSINKQVYGRNNDARRMLGMTTLQNKTIDPNNVKAKDLHTGFCATCDASRKHDRLEFALEVFTYQEQIEQIVDLITTTVGDPDEWLDEESTLTEINGSLLIKTTPENHAQIRKLFESMRAERGHRFKRQALEMEVFLLLEDAETARLKQDYHTALQKINQALRVNPSSPEAQTLKDIVTATLSR